MPEGLDRLVAMEDLLSGLTELDPEKAASYIDRMPAGEERNRAVAGMLTSSDPERAAKWISHNLDAVEDPKQVYDVVADWSGQGVDPEELNAWIQSLPEGKLRREAQYAQKEMLAQLDPADGTYYEMYDTSDDHEEMIEDNTDDLPQDFVLDPVSTVGTPSNAVAVDRVCYCECPCEED